jgi:ATP-dependent Lon protease
MFRLEREGESFEVRDVLPLLPLRDIVVFPYMIVPLLVGRPRSVAALEAAMAQDRILLVAAQRRADIADPGAKDIHRVGTVARILQFLRLPDGTVRVLVEGLARVRIVGYGRDRNPMRARVGEITADETMTPEVEALVRSVRAQFEEYVRLSRRIPDEVLISVNNIEDPLRLAHAIAAHLASKVDVKQRALEAQAVVEQYQVLAQALEQELEIVRIERRIDDEVRSQVQKNQKEFYLQEQLKAIRKELGEQASDLAETDELTERVRKSGMPRDVEEKAEKEIERLQKMTPLSPEAAVVRNYVEWLASLPWKKRTRDNLDIARVERILDEDHFGLKNVKERIVEYLAVLQRVGRAKSPIFCFVGPPGVGKTSLGRSIARALGRKFVRVSLGGVRDEAEIRGHRRTYIGSMPGKIIQGIKRAGTKNPVFLLDEVDKMSSDFRGDPASALLEVLDPEQNCAFNDHFLDVDFDLSEVLFITTGNVLHTMPPALVDRMEVIRLPGYLRHEKVRIAQEFLIPKQLKAHGLTPKGIEFTRPGIETILDRYTREAGVRNLEREICSILRKVAKKMAVGKKKGRVVIRASNVHLFLGVPQYSKREIWRNDRVGAASGLAWTEFGGDVMTVEAVVVAGKGELLLTGMLGEVMQESAQAALSYTRTRASALGLEPGIFDHIDIHVHVPEGAIPKDGPSAGVAIASALVSALARVPVLREVALTGEITLGGDVLPVGGLNEKIVAAQRAGFRRVLVPKENEKDLRDLPKGAREGLEIRLVETMDEVLRWVLKSPQNVHRLDEDLRPPGAEPGAPVAH